MQAPEADSQTMISHQSTVILVGASVRAAAQSAARAGISVIGMDLFGDRETIRACQQHYCLGQEAVNRITKDSELASIPILQVGGLSKESGSLLTKLPNRWLSAPPSDQVRFSDPEFLSELAASSDSIFPETTTSAPTTTEAGRWLQKSKSGCGGLAVGWHASDPPSADRYFQRWMPGRVYGASFISSGNDNGARLLGICRGHFTRIGIRPFVYSGSSGPYRLAADVESKIQKLGNQFVARTGLVGVFNVDVLVRNGQVVLLEVNPRWSGSMELIELDPARKRIVPEQESILGEVLSGKKFKCPNQTNRGSFYKRIVFARQRTKIDPSELEQLSTDERQLTDLPMDTVVVERGQPVCTVLFRMPAKGLRQIRSLI